MAKDTGDSTSRETDEGVRCDITNPTRAPRVIFTGMGNNNVPVTIPPGNTMEGVVLSRGVIKKLKSMEFADPNQPDLHVDERGAVSSSDDEAHKAPTLRESTQQEQQDSQSRRAPRPASRAS